MKEPINNYQAQQETAIAVMGYGTVGSGVIEVLKTNQLSIDERAGSHIKVKYVLDLRDFPGDPVEEILTHDVEDILNDDAIRIVVEVMGGVEPAYTFVKRALMRDKSVVTSNKALVAKHGAELLEIARSRSINFLFEASVGGGIPIIRPLNKSLTSDEIYEISGILNGTTNYILTKMVQDGRDFQDVLEEAQALGFAEKDPSADIEGWDSCRKIAILLSLAIGKQVDFENIYTEGITKITQQDLNYAKALEGDLKLLASAAIINGKAFARVSPVIMDKYNPLSTVKNEFNAIMVKGNIIGTVMFYGLGAGKLPTAGAVVSDVIDCAKHLNTNIMYIWSREKTELLPVSQEQTRRLVRVKFTHKEQALTAVKEIFASELIIQLQPTDDEFAFITGLLPESELEVKLDKLEADPSVKAIPYTIRLQGENFKGLN